MQVVWTLRINPKGTIILMDDEDVGELPQGQDYPNSLKSTDPRHINGLTDIQVDGNVDAIDNAATTRCELKLLY